MKIFPKFIFLMTGYCLAQTPGGLMTVKQFQALKSRPADYRIAPAEVPLGSPWPALLKKEIAQLLGAQP
jgi:hypothetical protein